MLLITQAWSGLDGKMEHMFERLNKVPEVAHTKKDLDAIVEDACELCNGLLEYEYDKSAAWTRSTCWPSCSWAQCGGHPRTGHRKGVILAEAPSHLSGLSRGVRRGIRPSRQRT